MRNYCDLNKRQIKKKTNILKNASQSLFPLKAENKQGAQHCFATEGVRHTKVSVGPGHSLRQKRQALCLLEEIEQVAD